MTATDKRHSLNDRIAHVLFRGAHWAPHSETWRRFISFVQFHSYVVRRLAANKVAYVLEVVWAAFGSVHKAATAKEVGVLCAGVVANVYALISPFSLVVGVIILGVSLFAFLLWMWHLIERQAILLDDASDSPIDIFKNASRDLAACGLSREDGASGFAKLDLGNGQIVFRSAQLDSSLRKTGLSVKEWPNGLDMIMRRVKARSGAADALRFKRANAMRLGQDFRNEPKLCLLSDLQIGTTEIGVGAGDYYTGWLTNDFCNIRISKSGQTIQDGTDMFPVTSERHLKPISKSGLENIIGIGTIGHTADNVLYFWQQSSRANQSQRLLAPTGSGSADPRDLHIGQKFHSNPIEVAMMRELLEEGKLIERYTENSWAKPGERGPIADTKVIGFFRWVNQGGKPEFVGATKLNVSRHEARADLREVEETLDPDFERKVETTGEMIAAIKHFLGLQNLSVPLYVNLLCLQEAVLEDPHRWADFFRIKQDLPKTT